MSDMNKAPWNVILGYTHLDYAAGASSSLPIHPHGYGALSLASFVSKLPVDHPFLLHVPPSDRPHLINVAAYLSGDKLAGVFSDVDQLDDSFLPHKILNRFAKYVAGNPTLSSNCNLSSGSELTCGEQDHDHVLPAEMLVALADDLHWSRLEELVLQSDNHRPLDENDPLLDPSREDLMDDLNTNSMRKTYVDFCRENWRRTKDEQVDHFDRTHNPPAKSHHKTVKSMTEIEFPLWLRPLLLSRNDITVAPFSFTTHANQTRKRRVYKRPRNQADDFTQIFAAFDDPIYQPPIYFLSQHVGASDSSSLFINFAHEYYGSSSPLYTQGQLIHKRYKYNTTSPADNDQFSTQNRNTNFITTSPGAGFVSLSMPPSLDQEEEIEEDNVQPVGRRSSTGGGSTDGGGNNRPHAMRDAGNFISAIASALSIQSEPWEKLPMGVMFSTFVPKICIGFCMAMVFISDNMPLSTKKRFFIVGSVLAALALNVVIGVFSSFNI